MKKLIESMKKHPVAFVVTTLIAFAIGTTVFLLFFILFGQYSMVGAINGTGVAFAVLLSVFAFVWLSRSGTFDTMSYGFNQMFASMFGRRANKYNDLMQYKEEKNQKREAASLSYFSFLAVAILFALAFAVLEILLHVL